MEIEYIDYGEFNERFRAETAKLKSGKARPVERFSVQYVESYDGTPGYIFITTYSDDFKRLISHHEEHVGADAEADLIDRISVVSKLITLKTNEQN
jgi:hypothetical protein